MTAPEVPSPGSGHSWLGRSAFCLGVVLLCVWVDARYARSTQGTDRICLVDLTHPPGYSASKTSDRAPFHRRDAIALIDRLTTPATYRSLPSDRAQVLAETLTQLHPLAREVLWHACRVLDEADDGVLGVCDRLYADSLAANSAYRADWVWIGERLTESLRIPNTTSPPLPPASWNPLQDPQYHRLQALITRHASQFRDDLVLEAPCKVLLIALLTITPQTQRSLGATRLAALQGHSRALCDAAERLGSYWKLLEGWIIDEQAQRTATALEPSPSPSPSPAHGGSGVAGERDASFVELAEALARAEQVLRASEAPRP